MKKSELTLRRVLEYTSFFNDENELDVISILKKYNRSDLIRMAALLSLHYGNFEMPNQQKTLFSAVSEKHMPLLNNLFTQYFENNGLEEGEVVQASTFRTSLELWRLIFSIRVEEHSSTMPKEDAELSFFKVILALNERIYKFNTNPQYQLELDELIFLNSFINNDANDYNLQKVLQPQSYYFYKLIEFIPTNDVMKKASDKLLAKWGLKSWKQYYATIVWLAKNTDDYYREHQTGIPVIPIEKLVPNDDEAGFFAKSLIEHLCINEEDHIQAEYSQTNDKKYVNIDYKQFRSKPFIKLKDGSGFIVINIQLLCERLYNSLFFDFMPLITSSKSSIGYFDYNKGFVERVLFHDTIFKCIKDDVFTWPKRKRVKEEEDAHEPDFYARYPKGELLIIECKAIKMNGEIKDDADYDRLLDELHEKIVLKTRNIDSNRKKYIGEPTPIGIGQIVHHINAIEADQFIWDNDIPDEVAYYPMLVFEDVRLLQPGLMSILNRWFYDEIRKNSDLDLTEIGCRPIVPVSINTLYRCGDKIKVKGLFRMIDNFILLAAKHNNDGSYLIDPFANFDDYLLRTSSFRKNKNNELIQWLQNHNS